MRRGAAIVALALVAGCGPPPPPVVDPGAGGVDADAVLGRLAERAATLSSIRAGLELVWDDPRWEEPESCRGSLSFAAPDRLRLRGHTAAFFTVFDLAADGEYVRLDVPREKLFVHGLRSDPAWNRLPFPPDLLRLAILADPCGTVGCPGARREPAGDRTAPDGTPLLALAGSGWTLDVEAGTLLPRRWTAGEAEIRWDAWAVRRGTPWPHEVEIRAPGATGTLRVGLGRLELGRDLPEDRFRLELEDDRDVLTPEEAAVRWGAGAAGAESGPR